MLESWLFWSLLTAAAWGVGQVVAKKALASFTPLTYNILSGLVGVPIFLAYGFSQGLVWHQLRTADFLILAFIVATYVLYYYIISLESLSLTATILATYPVTTIIFSLIFLKERLSVWQVVWIGLILLGVVLIGLNEEVSRWKINRWFYLACLTAIVVGFADFVAKIEVERLPLGNYFFWYAFAFAPGVFLAYLLDKPGRVVPKISLGLWLWSLLGALLIEAGSLFFFTALAKGPASLVSPMVSIYVALTVLLAYVFLKERIGWLQTVGVFLVILGVIFLGI